MKSYLYTFLGIFVLLASSCVPRPSTVALFNVETYIRPYQTQFDDTLIIVLDESISNDFEVRDNFRAMKVKDFRKSLTLSLYYTFKNSFKEVRFQEQPSESNLSLHLFRIRPGWKIQSINDYTYMAGDVAINASTYYLSSLFRYDGILYRNGEKVRVLDDEIVSEKVVANIRQWDEAFKDGVREMCEQLYKVLAEDQKAFLTKK